MFQKICVWVAAVVHFPHRPYFPVGNKITQEERPVLFLQRRNSTFIVIIYLEAFQSDWFFLIPIFCLFFCIDFSVLLTVCSFAWYFEPSNCLFFLFSLFLNLDAIFFKSLTLTLRDNAFTFPWCLNVFLFHYKLDAHLSKNTEHLFLTGKWLNVFIFGSAEC